MKQICVVTALALVFLACAGSKPQSLPRVQKPAPDYDSARVSVAKTFCGDDIFNENGKPVRCAEPFLEKGEPTGHWSLTGIDGASYDIFSWGGRCVMMSDKLIPKKVYERPALFQGIGSSVPQDWSQLNQSTSLFVPLPKNGQYEVILVSDVGLPEVNLKTHESREVRFQIKVFEIYLDEESGEEKERVVMEIDHRVNLEAWTWIASRSADLSGFAVPDHATFTLPPGRYRFKLRAIGSDQCQGEIEFTRTIPGRLSIGVDISNLLFVDPKPPTGDLNFLIKRWGREDLWPTSNFNSGESVTAITEAKAKVEGEYLVEVSLEKYVGNADPDTLREVIFSQVCQIGDTATLLEIHPSFVGVTPGAYWMYATITQPNTNIRAESMALIRVKEAKVSTALMYEPKEENAIAERVVGETNQLNYDSLLEEFADSELRAFFRIEDEGFFKLIDTLSDSRLFRANILEYLKRKDIATRPDTPENEWWAEKVRRYNWCQENLKTRIDEPIADRRWQYVLLLGLDFDGNPSLVSRSADLSAQTYRLIWKDGTELEFETEVGGSIPVKVKVIKPGSEFIVADALGRSGESDRPKGADYSALIGGTRDLNQILSEPKFNEYEGVETFESNPVMACLFSSEYGDYEEDKPFFESWWFTLTNANEFSESALAHDSLSHRLIVRDMNGEIMGDNEVGQTGLSFFLPLSRQERKNFFFPSVNAGGLEPGIYSANFSLRANGGKELASYQIDSMRIPPRTASLVEHKSGYWGTSDILFPTELIQEGNPGILIDGQLYYNSPVGIFSTGDSLPILMQVKTPAEEDYEVRVFLYQIDKDEELFKRISQPSEESHGEEHLVYTEKFQANDRGLNLLRANFDLSDLKPGKAAIIVRVLDPSLDPDSDDQPNAISYRRFVVIKPK